MSNIRDFAFLTGVATVFLVLIATVVRSWLRVRRSSHTNWDDLLGRLVEVDRASIAEVALDVVDLAGKQRTDEGSASLEPKRIWKLVGGMDGLAALEANCQVLIDLAFYLQQSYPEALAVAEDLRLSAREIQWHVGRLREAEKTGKLESSFTMYAQRAVATYFVMTRKVLALYERLNGPKLAELEKAL